MSGGASVGGGKNKQSSNGQQTTNQDLNPTLEYNLNNNYLRQAQTTLPSYGGPNLDLSRGIDASGQLMNYQPQSVTASTYDPSTINRGDIRNIKAGQLSNTNLSPYESPYINDVVNTSLSDLDRARQMAISSGQASATAAGAFGGSRHGVADSLTNDNFARNAASTAAQLRQAGFVNAQGAASQDIANRMQADTSNQGVDLNVAGQNAGFTNNSRQFNATAQNAASLANQSADLAGAGVRQNATGMFGTLAGNQYAANYGQHNDQVNQQLQLQQLWNQALGLFPTYGSTTTYSNGNTGGTQLAAGFTYGGK
jgi:hypothetical protein